MKVGSSGFGDEFELGIVVDSSGFENWELSSSFCLGGDGGGGDGEGWRWIDGGPMS